MIRQIILICLVAVFAYYAGANGLTVSKVMDWFDEREITQTVEAVSYTHLTLPTTPYV